MHKCYLGFAYPYEHVVEEEMDEAEALALNTYFRGTQTDFFIEESQQYWLINYCRKIAVSKSLVEVSQINCETVNRIE